MHACVCVCVCLVSQVFEDKSGAVVVSFDRAAAVVEGDLSAYMQNMAKNHWLVCAHTHTYTHTHTCWQPYLDLTCCMQLACIPRGSRVWCFA